MGARRCGGGIEKHCGEGLFCKRVSSPTAHPLKLLLPGKHSAKSVAVWDEGSRDSAFQASHLLKGCPLRRRPRVASTCLVIAAEPCAKVTRPHKPTTTYFPMSGTASSSSLVLRAFSQPSPDNATNAGGWGTYNSSILNLPRQRHIRMVMGISPARMRNSQRRPLCGWF